MTFHFIADKRRDIDFLNLIKLLFAIRTIRTQTFATFRTLKNVTRVQMNIQYGMIRILIVQYLLQLSSDTMTLINVIVPGIVRSQSIYREVPDFKTFTL